jgi:peptidoglycan pentaglycine glycine transferase (the first glycine)
VAYYGAHLVRMTASISPFYTISIVYFLACLHRQAKDDMSEWKMYQVENSGLLEKWNQTIEGLPGAHILQTSQWGAVKAEFGWKPLHLTWRDNHNQVKAAALVLQRDIQTPFLSKKLNVIYVPKGPMLDWGDESLAKQVCEDLLSIAHKRRSIFIKIDPDLLLGTGIPSEIGSAACEDDLIGQARVAWLVKRGWRYSQEQIQFRNTVLIDLTPNIDQLLANMKQKTRYNVRLAERKGVRVRVGELSDLEALYQMYAETSLRDGFVIRTKEYYYQLWSCFFKANMLEPLIAEVNGQMIAAILVFRFTQKAWYLHGMSTLQHRNLMPNYRLQWEAILRAKEIGCNVYDLWGAPERFDSQDPLWGVYRFKEGFGGEVARYMGAYDYPLNSLHYFLYTKVVPRILDVMRKRGVASTQRMVSA